MVAPRIEITVEPTFATDAESAYRSIKADLEGIGRRPDATMVRSSLGFRPVGPDLVGDLNARYRLGKEDRSLEVRHRSLLVWRRAANGDISVLSITATYLTADVERIAPEIQRMFAGLELLDAPDGGPSP